MMEEQILKVAAGKWPKHVPGLRTSVSGPLTGHLVVVLLDYHAARVVCSAPNPEQLLAKLTAGEVYTEWCTCGMPKAVAYHRPGCWKP
jgi:hypothetical protein